MFSTLSILHLIDCYMPPSLHSHPFELIPFLFSFSSSLPMFVVGDFTDPSSHYYKNYRSPHYYLPPSVSSASSQRYISVRRQLIPILSVGTIDGQTITRHIRNGQESTERYQCRPVKDTNMKVIGVRRSTEHSRLPSSCPGLPRRYSILLVYLPIDLLLPLTLSIVHHHGLSRYVGDMPPRSDF